MAPWKGRKKGLRVFIRDKPHPNGIKIYILADRTGYVYDFWIYRGTQPSTKEIVLAFANCLPGPGYILTFDAYYGGWNIAVELDAQQQYFVASCSANRPSAVFAKALHQNLPAERGSWKWLSWSRQILAISWRDRKILNLLTNTVEKPRKVRGKKIKGARVHIPNVVEQYRSSLNYVDRANAYRLRYPFRHRVIKNTRAQWQTMIFMTIVNAWILHTYVNEPSKKMKYKDFFAHLAKELADRGGVQRSRSRGGLEPPPKSSACHVPKPAPKRGTCAWCREHGVKARGNCTTICSTCRTKEGGPVYLHACKNDCFLRAHNLV